MSDDSDDPEVTAEKYMPDQDRTLSDAVLEAIEEHTDDDVSKSDLVLYEDVDPDALDELFRRDASPRTKVGFDTDDLRIELYGDGGVVIRVNDTPSEDEGYRSR